jgi:hypothetical protein
MQGSVPSATCRNLAYNPLQRLTSLPHGGEGGGGFIHNFGIGYFPIAKMRRHSQIRNQPVNTIARHLNFSHLYVSISFPAYPG